MALDNIVPEDLNWLHTDEGPEYASQYSHCHLFRVTQDTPLPYFAQ